MENLLENEMETMETRMNREYMSIGLRVILQRSWVQFCQRNWILDFEGLCKEKG